MSVKRQATTELNHENWDQEDPSEHEEMGSFKAASKDILEKRVIRTAKRRTQASGYEPKNSVFSTFGGFNKAAPSSFDFLANLTNGNKTVTDSQSGKTDTTATSNVFGMKPVNSGGVFNMPTSSSPPKPTFGIQSPQTSSLFAGTKSTPATSSSSSLFTASKSDSTVADNSFKTLSSSESKIDNDSNQNSKVTSTIFSGNTGISNKSLFSGTNFNSTIFNTQPLSSSSVGSTPKPVDNSKEAVNSSDDKKDDKKIKYYSKLKGLNESVSDWIKKHVEETPLCILSPIFKDYERYLKEIQDEYHGNKDISKDDESSNKSNETNTTEAKSKQTAEPVSSPLPTTNFSNTGSLFGSQTSTDAPKTNSTGFSFGINTATTTPATNSTTSAGFSFGITTTAPAPSAPMSSPFSLNTNTTTNNSTAPFSFGIGKPFSFNSNIQSNTEQNSTTNEEEDEPPKVDFTPIVEDNSVFDKRCKIFVKKDGNFMDKGVGTLYIKKIEETGKHQLLVRANTNLGNVLVNLILSASIPIQRLGKNNVMMVCIPTPDAKPPPTPILIRVKTSDEADELLETLNKFRE